MSKLKSKRKSYVKLEPKCIIKSSYVSSKGHKSVARTEFSSSNLGKHIYVKQYGGDKTWRAQDYIPVVKFLKNDCGIPVEFEDVKFIKKGNNFVVVKEKTSVVSNQEIIGTFNNEQDASEYIKFKTAS